MRRASTALGQAVDSGAPAAPAPDTTGATPAGTTGGGVGSVAGRPRPDKPVRFTLDLTVDLHRFLKRFALEAEVDAARVMRALLTELRTDPGLAERVRTHVWDEDLHR